MFERLSPAAEYCVLSVDNLIRPLYGECLAGASLSIGKYSPIVSLKAAVSNRLGNLLEDDALLHFLISDIVKVECLVPLHGDGDLVLDIDALFAPSPIYFKCETTAAYFSPSRSGDGRELLL